MSVAFSPDGRWLAVGGSNRTLRIWEVETGRLVQAFQEPYPLDGVSEGCVPRVVFHPAGHLLACVTPRDEVRFRETTTWEEWFTIADPPDDSMVKEVVFSPDGTLLAIALYYAEICFWDICSRAPLEYVDLDHRANALAFSPDGTTLAAVLDRLIQLVDVPSRQILGALDSPGDEARAVAFSPNGRVLATGHWGGATTLWDTASRELMRVLHSDPTVAVSSLAFAPDGSVLAVGDSNNHLRIWDVRRFVELASFSGAGRHVCYSADGSRMALTVGEGVQIWDTVSLRQVL
jgi:WD40 repeat protein